MKYIIIKLGLQRILEEIFYIEKKDKYIYEVIVGGRLNSIRIVNGKKNIIELIKWFNQYIFFSNYFELVLIQ